MEAMDEIVAEFLVESHENLDQLDRDLLALERSPASRELLASVFRTIHTIKGTSGFLAFHQLERLTHVGENLLNRLRDGVVPLDEDRLSALLRLVDVVRHLLRTIESTGEEGVCDLDGLIGQLTALLQDVGTGSGAGSAPGEDGSAPGDGTAPGAGTGSRGDSAPGEDSTASGDGTASGGSSASGAEATPAGGSSGTARSRRGQRSRRKPSTGGPQAPAADAADAVGAAEGSAPEPATGSPDPLGKVLVEAGATSPDAVQIARMEQELGDSRRIGHILVDHGTATVDAVTQALEVQDSRRSVVDSSVRVDVELLDSLMRLVGELVLARNQLVSRLEDTSSDPALTRSAQRLSLVTSELQEQVMRTRMQPVDTAWNKIPRVVRDLAKQCGRQVRVAMEGRDTELDRSVLEAIRDPLTHMVRNAVDHGIEPPEVRRAAGKPEEGVLRLRAYHEAGQVHLEISDDGAGIDPERIAAKALERDLVTPAQLAQLRPQEIIQMIFLSGFSLSKEVTNLSGRGVGMDVVKTRIEGIGGSVDVVSEVGKGTTFRLTIPLTLAIIPALTIGCEGRRYAVPQVSVLELVRLSGEHARGGIELIAGAPVYRLRDTLLPLVRLDEQLGLAPVDPERGEDDDVRGGFIVVQQAEPSRFGLVVDDVLDTQEIVVKPLGRHLKGIQVYAGATILGDGSVVLILDAATLARSANVLHGATAQATEQVSTEAGTAEPVLVVEVGSGRRSAIPLDMVTRLEEINTSAIERVGGREVVQYRGHIMPLVRLADLLGTSTEILDEDRVQTVVYTRGTRSVGLVVQRIHDIATERCGTRSDVDGHGLLGSVVVGDRVVELLDVESAVLAADPTFFSAERAEPDPHRPGDLDEEVLT